jgi:hypothetical protein
MLRASRRLAGSPATVRGVIDGEAGLRTFDDAALESLARRNRLLALVAIPLGNLFLATLMLFGSWIEAG